MHIRFNSAIAGSNFSYGPGDVADWPDEKEGARLVQAGIADELTADEAVKVAQSAGRPVRRHRSPEQATRGHAQTGAEKATAR